VNGYLSSMEAKPPTYEELVELNRRQARQIDELRAEVERLKAELEHSHRAGKRQAAPFSKGGFLLARSPASEAEAEGCFRRSLEVARRQSARSWELRGAMSLGRLLRSRGDVEGARSLVARVHGTFTQGFDHPDLREARAFLDDCSAG